ncbi:hypothetical protein LRR81_05375 [Metabacillus sp. GX 13764]|uniref:hypothetical protein n=1 Tax=Metabacillus kandeliae TaxID=2900151 RepID=UPI001E392D02|nr:hypothetical protein [Metabacillus kandeliae]MCD7033655.1 hypothetical protein [Metabacillus kandeliae]
MPYHKNKQQSFQAAQQSAADAVELNHAVSKEDADYGSQMKHVKEEVNEAFAQIDSARENASATQNSRLDEFQQEIETIADEMDRNM